MRRVPQPAQVLKRQRIVQAELLAELRDELLLGGPIAHAERCGADHGVDRIAGNQMQDREDEDGREQQDRDRLGEPLRDVPGHASPLGGLEPTRWRAHVVVVSGVGGTCRDSRRARSSGGCTFRKVA